MKNTDLELIINEKLSIENFHDYAPNGLQVEGRPHIPKNSDRSNGLPSFT
ncbi:metal-binding protein [Proteus mirabilis]|uniref:Metal-binding protein n=1 Tax=Proteus mirabilis TaxID=584 RepID=A0A379FH55_PROMI|nr:metal-binding protein [Proteus mirabilis]